MDKTINKHRNEIFLVVGLVTLYVIRQLGSQVQRFEDIYALAVASQGGVTNRIVHQLSIYDHTLNNNVPLIAGALLVLLAWFVFHQQAYPRLQQRLDDPSGWLLTGLAAGLLLAGTLVYHYLKLQVNERYNDAGAVIGLKVYSLYRKRTVLADAVGFGIVVSAYELAYQYYRYLTQPDANQSPLPFRLVSYILLGALGLLAILFVLNGRFPETLWQGSLRDTLLLMGLVVQIMFLQQYAYTYLLRITRAEEALLFDRVGTYLLLAAIATTVILGASTRFYFYYLWNPVVGFVAIVLIGATSIAYLRQVLTKEKTMLQTQVSVGAAELAGLRAQINPHFLFNALNSLYATALKEKGEQTADGIQKLGDMMRFMLQENNRDRIPLDKEIEYLRNYIAIQRMRLDETHDITIRVTIQEPNRPVAIAPMLLTPFVENAFKHGISLRSPSWIHITLTLDATTLYFKVHNSRHSRLAESTDHHDPEATQSGVGLANVRKRLALIYPGQHTLDIQQSEQDYFVALTLVYW